ncbi:MAG: hypothetical protein ACRDZW_04205, partial [Acidimicrobiales bacterium]
SWDPQIRGAAIVLAGIFMLMGSVYLLLSTNMGARLGMVLAVAGLTGWMGTMGAVWMVFGIGLKGAEPEWKVQDVLTGEAAQSTVGVMDQFPETWEPLITGDAELADAIAAADRVLAPTAAPAGGHEEGGGAPEEKFDTPFRSTGDYVLLDGFRRGGQTYLLHTRHRPHYAVIQVKPSFFEKTPAGLKAQPDLSGPTTTVVMLRDLGNLRFPPFVFTMTSFTIFGVAVYSLHQRDKEIMAAKAARLAATTA